MTRPHILTLLTLFTLSTLLACGGTGGGPKPGVKPDTPGGGTDKGPATTAANKPEGLLDRYDVTVPNVTYAWDPNAGDPTVPAEQGGPGFTGEGWETKLTFPMIGSSEAKKGGAITIQLYDWPATLRQTGKDWNTSFNYMMNTMAYESLLQIHPTTLDFIPSLASHWQISEDKSTYRFRINPEARWSNGDEVTADDVVASFQLRMDPTTLDPSAQLTFGKLEEPVAVSKYIVEVKVKEESWRNFLYFSGMSIFPAKEVSIKGSDYLDKYQFSYTANTGPYMANPEEFESGASLIIRRRTDWWDADNPAWTGLYNIDTYKVIIVKEPQLAFEKVKKGEIDFWPVPKAQWWAEEIPKLDPVKQGLLQMKKVFNDAPVGTSGLAFNMSRPPLDNKDVRLALAHLQDRKTMIEKLYFNEYKPLNSYYQGGIYQNPSNEMVEYDEFKAVELLEKAGYTETNEEGYRVKDGQVLQLTLNYRTPLSERSLTIFQEACKRAGVKIDLQLLTPAAAWKNLTEKEYDIMDTAWGALVFPNPETSWHSNLADQKNNNNVTAFANERVDELLTAYDKEYDPVERVKIIREIDGIIYDEHPYALQWYLPCQRFLYWRKIKLPKFGASRIAEDLDLHFTWWVDPEMAAKVEEGKSDPSIKLTPEEVENRWWQAHKLAQEKAKQETDS